MRASDPYLAFKPAVSGSGVGVGVAVGVGVGVLVAVGLGVEVAAGGGDVGAGPDLQHPVTLTSETSWQELLHA